MLSSYFLAKFLCAIEKAWKALKQYESILEDSIGYVLLHPFIWLQKLPKKVKYAKKNIITYQPVGLPKETSHKRFVVLETQ